MDKEDLLFVRCSCYSPEHQMIISRNREDKEFYIQTHLITYENVFKRILAAFKYIFGYKCRYGNWDSIILTEQQAKEISSFLME